MTDPAANSDPAVTSLTAKAGDKVDNYTIMEQVGTGGTAVVFRGHDHVLNRNVAIKQLVVARGEAGEEIRQRALAEAQMHKQAAASDPRLLVQYIDTINDPRGLFLISEYVDGPSLEWIIQQETGPMDQRQALGIIAATAKALDALHRTGVVHRDLKPANILMPRDGGLKLADFGLAALVADQQTMDLGSVRYMAPEVLQGLPATPKSDLYALGMIAYELFAGRDNFNEAFRTILRDQRNQSMRWVKWHTNARAKVATLDQLVEGFPPAIAQLVARMMEKDPARRVGSAAELLEAIRSQFSQDAQPPTPGPHAAMAPPKIEDASETAVVPQRSKLVIISALMLVLWGAVIGGFFIWRDGQMQQAQANRTAALITAIEEADNKIQQQDYEAAGTAFLQVRTQFDDQFDEDNRRYRDDLVDAGVNKADALRAALNDDFITALDKARAYRSNMSRWTDQPETPRTGLSLTNADKLIEQYTTRAAFQERTNEIAAMLDAGDLDQGIQAVRLTRTNAGVNTAAEDLAKLDKLEARYNALLLDQRITDLLAQANRLAEEGEIDDAIDVLQEEVEDNGADTDPRVVTLLGALNVRGRIESIKGDISRAESAGDEGELLELLKELQRVQPTQALNVRIRELEVRMMLERAEDAINAGRTAQARDLLGEVLEMDSDNQQAPRLIARIDNAASKVEAERRGDQFRSNSEYTEAIEQYRLALSFGPDVDGTINAKIKDAAGEINLENSQKALNEGNVQLAQSELDKAQDNHGDTAEIRSLQVRIDDLRDYSTLVAEGDALSEKKVFGRAKLKYLDAKKIFDSEAINEKISDCDFGIWLSQCDRAILARDWNAAESALRLAEQIKRNDETEARREKINARVQ